MSLNSGVTGLPPELSASEREEEFAIERLENRASLFFLFHCRLWDGFLDFHCFRLHREGGERSSFNHQGRRILKNFSEDIACFSHLNGRDVHVCHGRFFLFIPFNPCLLTVVGTGYRPFLDLLFASSFKKFLDSSV